MNSSLIISGNNGVTGTLTEINMACVDKYAGKLCVRSGFRLAKLVQRARDLQELKGARRF
jgi:hypothetical protein